MSPKIVKNLIGATLLLVGCGAPNLTNQTVTEANEQQESYSLESKDMDLLLETETKSNQKQNEDFSIQVVNTDDINSENEIEKYGKEEKTISGTHDNLSINTGQRLDTISYDLIEIDERKEGEFDYFEMGLYWPRYSVQQVFYPDVQEICEEAFGDYLSPLQGLVGVLHYYDKRFRTDKETALVSAGKVRFYLFIENSVAMVTIEDNGETYHTEYRILREEEASGIRVLEIPPPGGIGVAGNWNRPEKPNYAIHKVIVSEENTEYTKADMQLVFDTSVQNISKEVFGDYVQALQGLYMLAEQEGYGDCTFTVQDSVSYTFHGHYETTIIGENYCEFTLTLGAPDRARITITKEGNQYITTFRLLKEGEYETEARAG